MLSPRKAGTPPPRHGLDPWLSAGGIHFATWDQWFLLLLFGEHDGDWAALRARLRDRCWGPGFERDDAEAKLSHLGDLETRWASLGDAGCERLRRACGDRRLLRRARAKILEQEVGAHDKTPAIRETPRGRLRERALRGYWPRFPVSPARYEAAFRDTIESQAFHGERATFGLARRLDRQITRALERGAGAAGQVAVRRAFLTSLVLAMERADDSCGVISELAHEHVPGYFTAPGARPDCRPSSSTVTASSGWSGSITHSRALSSSISGSLLARQLALHPRLRYHQTIAMAAKVEPTAHLATGRSKVAALRSHDKGKLIGLHEVQR